MNVVVVVCIAESDSFMKQQRQSRHLMLLLLSLIACSWAIVGLIYPSLMPRHVTVLNVALIGAFLASSYPDDSPYVVVRYSVLSMCFGVGALVLLIRDKWYFGFALGAAMFLYELYLAWAWYRRRVTHP